MKTNNDPFMRLRIIFASLVLTIILGAWLIYGYSFLKTNPAKILTNLSEIEKENINNYFNKLDLTTENNYTISLNNDKLLYLYSNPKEKKIYLYNDKEYYSIEYDSDTYKSLIYSFIDSITHNYKILDKTKKKDDKKDYYIYSYSLNELYPLIKTLKTDKRFIEPLKSFKIDDKIINRYNSNSIGLNIITKGSKRDIVYYNIKIDNLFDIYKEGDYINGFFLNYSFTYNKKLIIYTENNEYNVKINKNNNKFDINNYKKSSFKNIISIIK